MSNSANFLNEAGQESGLSLSGIFDERGFTPGRVHFPGSERAVPDGMDAAAEKAQEMRDLVNMAYSGVLKNDKVGLREGTSVTNLRGDDSRTRGAVAAELAVQQSYQQAYNNQVSFMIGGREMDFSQGEMHGFANDLAAQEQDRLDQLRREGADPRKIREAEENLQAYQRIAALTDPAHGPLTTEEQREIQGIFDSRPEVAESFQLYSRANADAKYAAETIEFLRTEEAAGNISAEQLAMREQEILEAMDGVTRHQYEVLQENKSSEVDASSSDFAAKDAVFTEMFDAETSPSTISYANGLDDGLPFDVPGLKPSFLMASNPYAVPVATAEAAPPANDQATNMNSGVAGHGVPAIYNPYA